MQVRVLCRKLGHSLGMVLEQEEEEEEKEEERHIWGLCEEPSSVRVGLEVAELGDDLWVKKWWTMMTSYVTPLTETVR